MISYKKSIEEMCKSCTYDKAEPGSWRQQVENCKVYTCPLWEVRPVTIQNRKNKKVRIKPK